MHSLNFLFNANLFLSAWSATYTHHMSAVFQKSSSLHSCELFLNKEIERSGTKQNECPTCTCPRSITIPEGGVNAIPQNLRICFQAEVVEYMSKIGSYDEKS